MRQKVFFPFPFPFPFFSLLDQRVCVCIIHIPYPYSHTSDLSTGEFYKWLIYWWGNGQHQCMISDKKESQRQTDMTCKLSVIQQCSLLDETSITAKTNRVGIFTRVGQFENEEHYLTLSETWTTPDEESWICLRVVSSLDSCVTKKRSKVEVCWVHKIWLIFDSVDESRSYHTSAFTASALNNAANSPPTCFLCMTLSSQG